MKFLSTFLFLFIFSTLFPSCKKNEVKGIKIGQTLYSHQNYQENRKLQELIKKSLDEDETALSELIHFPCGEASGCYDLGYIIAQIVYKTGETNFIKTVKKLNKKDYSRLTALINIGLEYGYTESRRHENKILNLYTIINTTTAPFHNHQ